MTRKEIIEQLERHRTEFAHDHGWNASVLESLDAAIKVLKQEPCKDAISRNLVLSTVKSGRIRVIDGEDWKRVMDNASEIRELPSVQPTACIAKISFDDQQMKEMIDKAISNLDFSDLISRQAVLDLCDSTDPEYKVIHFKEDVECLPHVQPEQKVGKWIKHKNLNLMVCKQIQLECSNCGIYICGKHILHNYCPNCGAKMEEGE